MQTGFGTLPAVSDGPLDPRESPHHPDCPQHPWNDVYDHADPCECESLRAEDARDAVEFRADVRRGK